MKNSLQKTTFLGLEEINIAWLAGWFEGKAYFGLDTRSSIRYKVSTTSPFPYIRISMTDEEVISKVAKLVDKTYFSPSRLTSKGKKVFLCHIGDRSTLKYLLPRLLPYMGIRRQAAIQKCLQAFNEWEKKCFQKG